MVEERNYLQDFTTTEQKLEWQCGADCKSVWDGIIQFKPSGITVKRPNVFPALVVPVQIPVIGKVGRRLTPREAARLQSRIPLYATKTIIGHTSRLIASLARRQKFCRYRLFYLKPAAYHAMSVGMSRLWNVIQIAPRLYVSTTIGHTVNWVTP